MFIKKTLRVWPHEAELLREVELDQLEGVVRELDLPEESDKPRPLRIRIPRELAKKLEQINGEKGIPQLRLLVNAAREYRRRFPVEPDWEEPGPDHGNEAEDLVHRTLRMHHDERELIRNLGRGVAAVPNRRVAFEHLVHILEGMEAELPNNRDAKRVTLNLKVPDGLADAVLEHVDRGHSFASVMVAAAEAAASDT